MAEAFLMKTTAVTIIMAAGVVLLIWHCRAITANHGEVSDQGSDPRVNKFLTVGSALNRTLREGL